MHQLVLTLLIIIIIMIETRVYQIDADELDRYIKQRWQELEKRSNGQSLIIDGIKVEVMTGSEVEAATGLSYVTLWRNAKLPQDNPKYLAPLKHNGRIYYKREDVERYLHL